MSNFAVVNYHIKSDDPQYFKIDANGVAGNIVPPTLVSKTVPVVDERRRSDKVTFENNGVEFCYFPSKVNDFLDSFAQSQVYEDELTRLVKNTLNAKEVVVFDHTIRASDENSNRKPVKNVHSDYSQAGAQQRLIDLLGEDKAAQWNKQHFAFVNVWRPLEYKVAESPLGFIDSSSVKESDWEVIGLKYPDRQGEILGLTFSEQHKWFYLSEMTPEEVVLFNVYDNHGLATVAHSALEVATKKNVKPRKSIESRLLIRY